MKTAIVGSGNPVKRLAVAATLDRLFGEGSFEVLSASADSGVSDQPISDEETLRGARNRAANARRKAPEADLWVGVEGGIEDTTDGMIAFAWVHALTAKTRGDGRTASFFLPPEVAKLVRQGVELGEADDRVFGRSNSKQKEGAIGILSGGVLDRAGLYEHGVLAALLPLKNRGMYFPGQS